LSLPLSETDVDAFVLAGGRSSRMGRDKALIQFAGSPLIQHALGVLRTAGFSPRIAGGGSELSSFAPFIGDDPQQAGRGPLAGVSAALSATAVRLNVFLPVDLPLIPASLVSYLVHHAIIAQSVITVVSVAGFIQTFPAVIDRAAASALRDSLCSNDRKCLSAFQKAAKSVAGRFCVLPVELLIQAGQIHKGNGAPLSEWFLNINTPGDLARAELISTGVGHSVANLG